MSERINQHIWPGGAGSRCSVCGAIRRDGSPAGTPLGCIDRIPSASARSDRRVAACDDSEVISARLAELKAERDAILAVSGTPEDLPYDAA